VESKEEAWCTMKMDAAIEPCRATDYVLFVQDLKTGKEYATHAKQSSLYACIGSLRYPRSEGVEVEFWYSDGGFSQPYYYTPSMLRRETSFWLKQGDAMMKAVSSNTIPIPTPSKAGCQYCFLRTDKGGPCDAWKRVRHLL
jgi:hypothetical protein